MVITGHFEYYLISNSSTTDEYDNTFDSDTSTLEDSDESILFAPHESASDLSVIIFSSDSNDQLLDTWSEFGPDVFGPGLLKDGGTASYSPLLLEAVGLTKEPISPLSLDAFGLDDVHEVNCTVPAVVVTSVSDEQLSASPDSSCDDDDSIFSVSSQDGLLGILASAWSVNPSSDTDSEEQQPEENSSPSSPSLSRSDTSEEPDELDLTEEEEAILETLCIQVPDIVPTVEELAENPHVPAYVHVFSRHNINSKVVFPVRKPSPHSSELAQRRSSAFSDNVNSMFSQMSGSWARTKAEFKRPERTNSIGSMLSSKFAEIRNVHAFNRQTQEPLPRTVERDPYDSWPWIRTAIEAEEGFADEDSGEEDSTVFKSALEYFKV